MPANALRDLFKRTYLSQLMRTAKRTPRGVLGDTDFAKYQLELLQGVFPGVKFDFCAISTMVLDHNLLPAGLDCVLLNVAPSIIDSYISVTAHDELSPVVHLNPGRIIGHDVAFDAQSWQASPLFAKHCRIYDIHKILRIAFQYPAMERKVISFDYYGTGENGTWEALDRALLEIATFPFALSWLLRKGAIDEPRYDVFMERISDLTPTQITYLRKYVNSPWKDLSAQAKEMGYSHGGYKQALYTIRDALIDKLSLPESEIIGQKSRSLRVIDHDYAFLKMLGDPSIPLRKPA